MSLIGLVHDVLDVQLVDRRMRKMGRVDDVVLELRDGAPPRVACIAVGGVVLLERVGGWAARTASLLRRLLHLPQPLVTRLDFSLVREIGDCIRLDVDADATTAMRAERWLRERVVCRIPWSGSGAPQERK